MTFDRDVERRIDCKQSEFQTELTTNFLRGFTEVTPSMLKAFQAIFKSISTTMEQSMSSGDKKTIVLEKYAHDGGAEEVKSCMTPSNDNAETQGPADTHPGFRVISFSINDAMRKALSTKGSRGDITCEIEYDEFEAEFDASTWREALTSFRQVQMDAIVAFGAFVQSQTIRCEA